MQKYHGAVIDEQGNGVTNASIYIYLAGTGTLATLKKDDETTALNNPITSADTDNYDSKGNFGFKSVNGIYDIKIVAGDTTWRTERVLYDFNDGSVISVDNIQFPSTQIASADANNLDDYEEGTWTPVLSDGTNDASTYSNQVGYYTKIGGLVTVIGYLGTTNLGSVSGAIQINGLPFAVSSTAGTHAALNVGYGTGLNVTAGYDVGGYAAPSATVITLRLWDVAAGQSSMSATEWSATGAIMFTMSYRV